MSAKMKKESANRSPVLQREKSNSKSNSSSGKNSPQYYVTSPLLSIRSDFIIFILSHSENSSRFALGYASAS